MLTTLLAVIKNYPVNVWLKNYILSFYPNDLCFIFKKNKTQLGQIQKLIPNIPSPAGSDGINRDRGSDSDVLLAPICWTVFHTELSGEILSSSNPSSSPLSQKDFHLSWIRGGQARRTNPLWTEQCVKERWKTERECIAYHCQHSRCLSWKCRGTCVVLAFLCSCKQVEFKCAWSKASVGQHQAVQASRGLD